MHQGIFKWGEQTVARELVEGKRVLEVGSLDVNGSMQDHVKALGPAEFVGIDIQDGPGVDQVLDVEWLLAAFGVRRWDLILCFEMLEHCLGWQNAVYQMKESLDVGGWIVLTTRSPGFPYHEHPHDYWRYTPELMAEVLGDLEDVKIEEDPGAGLSFPTPGVFAVGRRTGPVSIPWQHAEPAPAPEAGGFMTVMVWPELEEILDRAVQAVQQGEDPGIVRQAFARWEQNIARLETE